MKSFVDRIAESIVNGHIPLSDITIVVPSERMISYLQRSLYTVDGRPKIAPKMVTIDRWIHEAIKTPVINKSVALFELYRIFEKDPIEHEIRTFDAFLNWGQLLLNDFDEIDRYLVNPKQLFKNLRDVKEIEAWSFNSEELSEGQLKFMAFWDKLGPYYFAFEERIKELAVTTKGKAYREAANNIDLLFSNPDQHIVFAGFNALSEAELSIFRQLHVMGRAQFFFDNDAYYLNDKLHEAGSFQRVILERLQVKIPEDTLNVLSTKEMELTVVECPQITGQAAVAGTYLLDLKSEERSETLVLLADEQQLNALLHHLPQNIEKANITLGLPLRNTALRTWFDLIFAVQEGVATKGSGSIYFKLLGSFIHHPFTVAVLPEKELNALYELEAMCLKNNWQFVSRKNWNFGPVTSALFQLINTSWENNWMKALELIRTMNAFMDECFDEKSEFEQALVRTFDASIQALQNTFATAPLPDMSRTTFRNLFQQHWGSESLAYYGNPLDGIQIMGLLETRGLDFKRIFVLGLNEGVMPPDNPIQTLIPMDLRKFFGLPTPRDKQGLFAHHFYRLLHSAEQVVITYTSASESIGSNEPSRFLQQLELELVNQNRNIRFTKKQYQLGNEERIETASFPKDESVFRRFDEMLQAGLSFSKLSSYVKCPLNFYYQSILQIGEEDKMEEDLESNTRGTIVHAVLEELFMPFKQHRSEEGVVIAERMVTIDDLKAMKLRIPLLVEGAFQEHFSKDPESWQKGSNHIQYEMVKELIKLELNQEIRKLEENPEKSLFIIDLEQQLETVISLNVRGGEKRVKLKGVVDRIDRWGGKLRIIDYKSPKLKQSDLQIRNSKQEPLEFILNKLRESKSVHGLQLLIYSYLNKRSLNRTIDEMGIVSFVSHSDSPFLLTEELTDGEVSELIENLLTTILEEMYDPNKPFVHNPNSKYCSYCGR